MTEQPNPNELLLITREELERCCSQMSAAGYKVSANYVEASVLSRSRPAPASHEALIATIDEKIQAARDRAYKQGYQAAMTAQQHQPHASPDADMLLNNLLAKFMLANNRGNFRPWNIQHIQQEIEYFREELRQSQQQKQEKQ